MDEAFLKSVLAGVPLALLLIGADGRIIATNPAAAAIFSGSFEGRHYVTVLRQPALLDAIEGTLRHRQPSSARLTVSGGRAGEAVLRVTATPVAAGGALICVEDTTAQEQAGQMRRDFVANVSHELRTPLTALLGFIETLKGAARDDPEARARFLATMEREAARMNRLVDDLLSLSRVEADERVRPSGEVEITALVRAAVGALRPMAAAQRVEIKIVQKEPGEVTLRADADQLTQVFTNLIENAVKYGGAGRRVTIGISRIARDTGLRGPAVRIDVADQGEGIDAIHLPRLTERFYRVDAHRSREKGGTGLGLAIVKHIVNRHRGRFRIESVAGQGSCFTVLLPVE